MLTKVLGRTLIVHQQICIRIRRIYRAPTNPHLHPHQTDFDP